MNECIEVTEVYQNEIPDSARCLEYNLNLLNQNSSAQSFDTIRFVYEVYAEEFDVSVRKTLLESTIENVRTIKQDPATLLVFIHYEPDPEIVQLAVSAYLVHRRCSLDNPFLATQDILSFLTNRNVVNRGAVFAGLICFGDRRVCSAVRPIRDSISVAEAREISIAAMGPLHRVTAEFCLTWLLDLANRKQYEVLEHIASAVSSMVVSNTALKVRDTQFNFGPYGFASNQSLPEVTLGDLLAELAPIINLLAEQHIPALDEMLAKLNELTDAVPVSPEQHKIRTRRKNFEHSNADFMLQLDQQ